MADIDAAIAHLDRLIRCYRAHTLHMGGMDAIVTSAATLIDEVKRLRAGGCARDQRTTQFCAEAAAKDAEIVRLCDELDDQRKTAAIHRALNERIAAVLGLTEPRIDPETGEEYLPSWHDMPGQVERLRAELEEARLTLAAEQGRQEGAPSKGWRWTDGVWSKDYPSGHHVRVRQGIGGGGAVMHVTHPNEPHRRSAWDNQRAAMLAADSAAG